MKKDQLEVDGLELRLRIEGQDLGGFKVLTLCLNGN